MMLADGCLVCAVPGPHRISSPSCGQGTGQWLGGTRARLQVQYPGGERKHPQPPSEGLC